MRSENPFARIEGLPNTSVDVEERTEYRCTVKYGGEYFYSSACDDELEAMTEVAERMVKKFPHLKINKDGELVDTQRDELPEGEEAEYHPLWERLGLLADKALALWVAGEPIKVRAS